MADTSSSPVLHALATRRSAKLTALRAPGPDSEQLRTILTIASRVPDHGKLVPWRFIVIEGERRRALSEFIGQVFDEEHPAAEASLRTEARARVTYAPLVIAVVFCPRPDNPKVPVWEQELTAGAACMNALHAAKALGFAAVWLTEWYAFHPRVLAHLGLSPSEKLAGFIHIGTDPDPREDRPRPDVAALTTRY